MQLNIPICLHCVVHGVARVSMGLSQWLMRTVSCQTWTYKFWSPGSSFWTLHECHTLTPTLKTMVFKLVKTCTWRLRVETGVDINGRGTPTKKLVIGGRGWGGLEECYKCRIPFWNEGTASYHARTIGDASVMVQVTGDNFTIDSCAQSKRAPDPNILFVGRWGPRSGPQMWRLVQVGASLEQREPLPQAPNLKIFSVVTHFIFTNPIFAFLGPALSSYLKTASQSLLCYSADLIQNSFSSKEFHLVLLFGIKRAVAVFHA